MKSDKNGCSTTTEGQEHYEIYDHPFKKGVKLVQYDYRTASGKLFSCVRPTLEECRAALAMWMVYND